MKMGFRRGTILAAALAVVCAAQGAHASGWDADWIDVTPQNGVWDEYYRRTDDPVNCSFRFRVSRFADSLGVEAFVRDDKVVVDNCPAGSISCETWKDDCLEVFFDGDNDRNPNTRGPEYETNPTPCNAGGEYAIAANGATQSDYASAKKCFGRLWGGVAEPWEEGGRRVGTHYRLWFKYECLGRPVPRPDEDVTFGFTICVHDDDDGGANDLALYWKGNPKIPYADESAFGSFTFKGRPEPVYNPYGACAHVTRGEPPARTCAMMREAGMGWVRSDFDWYHVETKKGEWNFSRFDSVVAECEAEGLQLLPILGYSVWWARPAHEHLDAWEEYVRRVVAHYGRRLPVLEVWNEQNIQHFWKNPNPTNYLAVLRRTYETVKKVDPAIRVAFGGTAGVPLEFIEEVYRLGGAKWFDVMSIHPYSCPKRPEGVMDAQIEKLRLMMAKYGDAEKPIWITEVGWPTHHEASSSVELLLAGLKVARPVAKSWRIVYVPARQDVDADADEDVRKWLSEAMPDGSRVEVCRGIDLAMRLSQGGVDAVVYPFSENYASDSVDAVHAFVKDGGVLVDFGGMPMHSAYCTAADGTMQPDGKAVPWRDRQRLRMDVMAWWMDKRYPESMPVHPTVAAKGLKGPAKGFSGQRFLTDRLLKPGDEFIPLLSSKTNGIEAVAAAVYRFGSDMKGAVVASGIMWRGVHGASSEARQAKMAARALGIAFAEGVENVFWYEFRQPDIDPYDQESYFGLVHDNFAPKPAYGAYMTFVDARPAGSVQKRAKWRSEDGTDYFPQWTRPDGRPAGMVWTTGPARRIRLAFSSQDMTFVDVAGARVRPVREDGVYTLRISGSPIYFVGGELVEIK